MAKLTETWFSRFTTRYPPAVPVAFLLTGLGCWMFGAFMAFEVIALWLERSEPSLSESVATESGGSRDSRSATVAAGPGQVMEGAAGAAPAEDGKARRRRQFGLLTGVASLTVLGVMSVAFGVNWLRLVRLEKYKEVAREPETLN
jgi:hypothetical protein